MDPETLACGPAKMCHLQRMVKTVAKENEKTNQSLRDLVTEYEELFNDRQFLS